jgi:hypothetical protein
MAIPQLFATIMRRFRGGPEESAPPAAYQVRSLLKIAVERLRLIPTSGGPCSNKKKLVLLSELASLGYQVDNPEEYCDSALESYSELIASLKVLRGGQVDYVPLFQGFPDQVPDENDYFVSRLLGYLGKECLDWQETPAWLFDLQEFGADPITQLQDPKLFQAGVERASKRAQDSHTEWVRIRFASTEQLMQTALDFLKNNLYAASSIQESLRADLELLLELFGPAQIDPSRVVFKETRTYLAEYFWILQDYGSLKPLCDTPTDILRLMASLTKSDVSLAAPIKYPKLNKPQQRFVLSALEGCSNLCEDLQRYRGLWLALARGLHPGAHSTKFPKTAQAFNQLRNSKIVTFESRLEAAFASRDIDRLLETLDKRPGVFARRLHQLLEVAGPRADEVLAAFGWAVPSVTLKNLLVMKSHFTSTEESPYRTVINKRGRIRVLKNRLGRLSQETTLKLIAILEKSILNQIRKTKSSWSDERVWIDERLRKYTVPLQLRKASPATIVLGRGSRVPVEMGKTLRLFVYWKDATMETDLDLSIIQFGADLNYIGHVSWTRLTGDGIVHSGDIQSAPHGAAEFIDINLATLTEGYKKCRYIAPQIHRYRGDTFAKLTCHSGWMMREKSDGSYKTFDIKTVVNKFDLNGQSSYAMPILIDLWQEEIIYVDLYVGDPSPMSSSAEGALQDISLITGEMTRMLKTRPTMYELAICHAQARGAKIVAERSAASITFGLENCNYGTERMEQTLSELL